MSADAGKDPDWVEAVRLRACQLFTYRCPVSVDTLKMTDDPKVRFCEKCREEVHFCDSESELNQHAALGHCAAVTVRVPRRKDDWKGDYSLPVLLGVPRRPGCVLCNSGSETCRYTHAECGVFEDPRFPDIIHFDTLRLENEAFQEFSDRWVHAKCMLNWKYRDGFIEAWNSALQERFIHKRLFVSANGNLRYTHSLTWLRTNAEAKRQAQREVERKSEREEAEKANKARDQDRASRMAALEARCAGARRKAIAMGIATEDNVNRILQLMPKADFHRHFGEFDVFPFFF